MFQRGILGWLFVGGLAIAGRAEEPASRQPPAANSPERAAFALFLDSHCLECHDQATNKGGLALDEIAGAEIAANSQAWEKVVRKLASRQMPPPDRERPEPQEFDAALGWLTQELDVAAAADPNPGRTETFRRLNRAEYKNAIRDLVALDVDVAPLLPPDESSHGFDNITVSDLSPTLLGRYLSAAQKISRLALGHVPPAPGEETFRVRPDITQDSHIAGLPIGTRGGTAIQFNFPQDGQYVIQVWLVRDRNDAIDGLHEPHELEVMLDRRRLELFAIQPPPPGKTDQHFDADLKTELTTTAGPHSIGVTFLKKSASLLESTTQPLNVHFNFYRHPRLGPAVYQVSVFGPYHSTGPGNTPDRRRILIATPGSPSEEEDCARRIIANLARRAFRRPVDVDDLNGPLVQYRLARAEGDFEAGIEAALSAVLVSPQFLFHIERDPPDVAPAAAYRLGPLELASRLSFFLWSSLPDDELLDLAARGELSRPEVLRQQVGRMLADPRRRSLVDNFAGQWLYLRNLEAANPEFRRFPDFDDNLRQAMRRETEEFFESSLRDDRGVLELIKSDHTYLNERLARHYGVPHVVGSHFRRVSLPPDSERGGLLRQGSILTVTSYATRTSPVIRGHWVLKNLLGSPPPPQPPNVPALQDNTVSATLPLRERLAEHRANAACANCHQLMDPIGFALENFDAVGHWRFLDAGQPIDATGGLADGRQFVGPAGLEQAVLERPELFVQALTEKLLAFALGRGVEYDDAPAVRKIVAEAKADNYRFSRLIVGIVESVPFQMRKSP